MDLTAFADEVGSVGPVTIVGRGTRGGAVRDVRCVTAPTGIEWIQADEMTVGCGAGTPIDELDAALREVGQRSVLPAGGTVGGALAMGRSGVRRLGDGPLRDALLQTRYVGADGSVVKAGGPTVKNVSGFDVCRLLVGSQGTLGFLGDVIVRTRPIALSSQWFVGDRRDPFAVLAAAYRPVSVLWNGVDVWVLLEGHARDVAEQADRLRLAECDAPPPMPRHRRVVAPSTIGAAVDSLPRGEFVVEMGVGVVHSDVDVALPSSDPAVARLAGRVKQQFDPAGRLNPGVVVG
ncbi:MAG: FAD-binding protein [Actinomycetota bacterium]